MSDLFDVIIVGSGFGGSVTALRLAEAGMSVLVLERGRRWQPKDYPRQIGDAWSYDPGEPHKQNGWIDFRRMDDLWVVQGAGVGGGSLIYANVIIEPKPELFAHGWPDEITYEELKRYYAMVEQMLKPEKIPPNQLPQRYHLMREGARKLGHEDRHDRLPLAVTFDPEWSYDLKDPFNEKHSKTRINEHGQEQGTCVHLGNCVVGCDVKAKNTLDLNYIPAAEKRGAEVRPLHVVTSIVPEDGTYRVHFDRIDTGRRIAGSAVARTVILAAGSLGSTELLLKCKHQYRTLPAVSDRLGYQWSANGDFLTPAFHDDRKVSPTQGPTISSGIDFLDGSLDGQQYLIEDGGFPDLVGNVLEESIKWRWLRRRLKPKLVAALERSIRGRDPLSEFMPWFGMGVDAADGRLYLGRVWYAPWRRKLKMDWDIKGSKPYFDAIARTHEKLARSTGGTPLPLPTWTLLKDIITPHPLGGCAMANGVDRGVVDHRGEVFGYPGLFVADGSIVPEAIGPNPSKTIAALAERIATFIPNRG